ncbi:MAG: hypothetical protein ACREGE_01920 [Candidatus Microsaccharimonas sp.]
MEVAPRLTNAAKDRIMRQRNADDEALRARYAFGVQGPLEQSTSEREQMIVHSGMRWSRVAGTVLEKFFLRNVPVSETSETSEVKNHA